MRIYSLFASVWIFASVGCGGSVDDAERSGSTNDADTDSATSDAAPTDSAPTDAMTNETITPQPGGDRDAHGCIGSAGYEWCAKEMKCVRRWELATEKGFPNTAEELARYCAG